MLSLLAFSLAVLTLGLIAMQVIYVLGYQAFMDVTASVADSKQDHSSELDVEEASVDKNAVELASDFHPPAAVVLCLKGKEENLVECLMGLVSQDYAHYQLFIVVDSDKDLALEAVASFFADREFKPIVQTLRSPLNTCSLKCSAITQAIGSIPSRYKVIALIDGDTVPDQSWLSDLVEPLADPVVGATTGNRWYSPTSASLGAWVRKIWNAAAIVQMQRYQVPWGGSLAFRTETVERCGLVEHWRKSFCEDTAMIGPMRKQKLKLHRVPHLVLENTESVSLAGAFDWISRQLLTVRLHHPKWSLIAAHALASGLVAIASPVVIVLMLVSGDFRCMWTLIQAFVAWQLVNSWLLWMVEQSNRQALEGRGSFNRLPNEGKTSITMQILGTVLTQWMYPFMAWQTSALDHVWWRGVRYKVGSRGTVKLLENTDAAAELRGGNKESAELLATGIQRDAAESGDEDNADGSGGDRADGSGIFLPSRFSKRSRN